MEENKTNVVDTNTTENTVTQTVEKNEVKSFTQEDVNRLIKKEKDRVENKYKDFDFDGYNKWVEEKKTETEKQTELTQKNVTLTTENETLKNKLSVVDAGVDKEYRDFVLFTVSQMEGDFEDNLNTYLKNNEKYLTNKVETSKSTGVAVNKLTTPKQDGVLEILKAKHQDINF